MKKILIYGDSNVNGRNFITTASIPEDMQWSGLLVDELSDIKIYKNGLAGRLAGNYEKINTLRNGREDFLASFKKYAPFDIIIIALGTNDLQVKFKRSALDICEDLYWYKEVLYKMFENNKLKNKYFNEDFPTFIYLSPVKVDYKRLGKMFNAHSNQVREELNEIAINNLDNYLILDNVELFLDGIHLSSNGHKEVAKKLERVIKKEFVR